MAQKMPLVKLLNISLHRFQTMQLVYDQDIKTSPDVIEYVFLFYFYRPSLLKRSFNMQ